MIGNHSHTEYGKKLVDAAVTGLRAGQPGDAGRYFSSMAVKSLQLAAGWACAAWLGSHLLRRRAKLPLALGYAGIGFLAAMAWNSRPATRSMASSALREMNRVRDQHWLELNPIDYA